MNDERPGGPIRIGDKEREDAVKRLGEHYEAGRLSAEEYSVDGRVTLVEKVEESAFPAQFRLHLPVGWRPGHSSLERLTRAHSEPRDQRWPGRGAAAPAH